MSVTIAVFARAPVVGEVKSRLIPHIGAERAAALQHAMLRRTLRTASAASPGFVSLWCAPDCMHPVFAACAAEFAVPLFAQQGTDLGARMLDAFSRLCMRGPAILIGTDCPALIAADLCAAADVLTGGVEAVFKPAEDGGYVLIGLARPVASLFAAMPWGSDSVMSETRQRMRDAGMRWHELPVSWDVDRPQDFVRLEASGLMNELQGAAE